jgi:hypothetical protein
MEKRILNVSFGKSGNGGMSCRLSIPTKWVKEMGLTKEDKKLEVTFKDNIITIRKRED